MSKPFKDLSGQKFGLLTVVSLAGKIPDGHYAWNCKCECGNSVVVKASGLNPRTKSCGCVMRAKRAAGTHWTHGLSDTPEYGVWLDIKKRCYNPRFKFYKYYGERGIKVCERWLESFANFYEDMGPRPGPQSSIERGDVYGNYEPGNCSWIPRRRQALNRTDTVRITVNGVTKPLADWCRETGVRTGTAHQRIHRGWDPASAVTTPLEQKGR